jgi:hypothetical protein
LKESPKHSLFFIFTNVVSTTLVGIYDRIKNKRQSKITRSVYTEPDDENVAVSRLLPSKLKQGTKKLSHSTELEGIYKKIKNKRLSIINRPVYTEPDDEDVAVSHVLPSTSKKGDKKLSHSTVLMGMYDT